VQIAYFNGHFIPEDQAKIALNDPGFTWGATVTDRVRTYNRKYFRLDEHVRRFRRSCELCHIQQPVPDAELIMFAEHLLKENGEVTPPENELTLIYFATPDLLGMHTIPSDAARYKKMLAAGARLVTPATAHLPDECVPRQAKMRSRMFWWIAEQQARETDPDATALLLDLDGHVTETSFANFVIVRDGVIVSPPRESILDGVSLRFVEEIAGRMGIEFVENSLRPEDCYSADEALLTSTPFGIAGVSAINGRPIPWPGPVLQRLHQFWSAEVGADIWRGFLPGR
jgi:branched-chain amino acid aminotransferase